MKRLLLILVLVAGSGAMLRAQSMVGLPKEEVKTIMKEDHRKFGKDESVIKQRFNYLKYINGPRTKTWIIYFNEKNVCTVSKIIYDYGYYEEVLADIESKHHKTGDLQWEFMWGGEPICVQIIKQEWYFTVRESRKCKGE